MKILCEHCKKIFDYYIVDDKKSNTTICPFYNNSNNILNIINNFIFWSKIHKYSLRIIVYFDLLTFISSLVLKIILNNNMSWFAYLGLIPLKIIILQALNIFLDIKLFLKLFFIIWYIIINININNYVPI